MQTHKLLQFSEESRAYWHGRCGPPDLATNKRTFYRSNSYSSCRYQLHVSHDAAPNSASHPRAQQPTRMRRIGVLMLYPENDPAGQLRATAFRQELEKLGWVVGR